jgi:polyisoprenoid-binding protein YceI
MVRRRFALVMTAATALTVAASAAAATLKLIDKPGATFVATGVGGLKIEGQATEFKVHDAGDKLVIKAKIKDMKTGIGLRDKHTNKYLEAEKFPEAELTVEKSKIKFPEDKKKVSGKATGSYKMHGVAKDKSFDYTAERHGSDYIVSGRMEVNINDHKIETPCYLRVCVDPKVKVDVKFKLREN